MSIEPTLITLVNPKSPITEAYRTLQTNLDFSSSDEPIKSLTITSPGVSEGKSTTSANLALTYAQSGKKVLLVDCDLRCPRLHHLFQLSNQRGLSNILCLKEPLEDIKQVVNEHLDVLTTGPLPPNPVEFLNSNGLKEFIKQMRASYDMVIFDTPPVGILTDAALIAAETDGTLLVVATSKTDIELTKKSKEYLTNVKARLLGTVMTMVPVSNQEYYHYYSHYGMDELKPKRRLKWWGRKK